jgi:hypothetical protein
MIKSSELSTPKHEQQQQQQLGVLTNGNGRDQNGHHANNHSHQNGHHQNGHHHHHHNSDNLDSPTPPAPQQPTPPPPAASFTQSAADHVYDRFVTPEPPQQPQQQQQTTTRPLPTQPVSKELSLDSISISSAKSRSTHSKPQAPPPPPATKTTTPPANISTTSQSTQQENKQSSPQHQNQSRLDKISHELFEEICEEVIKCDDRAPSVPDVILQVISELLGESASTSSASNIDVAVNTTTTVLTSLEVVGYETIAVQNSNVNISKVAVESPSLDQSRPHEPSRQDSKKSLNNGTASITSNSNVFENKPSPPLPSTVARIISNYSITSADGLNVPKSSSSSSISSNSPRIPPHNNGKDSLTTAVAAAAASVVTNVSTVAAATVAASLQKLNRNRTRKTITKTFIIDGQTQTVQRVVNTDEEERQRKLVEDRKRDLIEHRRNLNEDRRKLVDLTRKQDAEKEALEADFKEQRDKLLKEFEAKLAQVYAMRKAEIERCEEAQTNELKSTLKRIKSEQERALKAYREQLKDEFKVFKKELEAAVNGAVNSHGHHHQLVMSKEHRDVLKKQKEKELVKRVSFFNIKKGHELTTPVFFKNVLRK